MAVTALSSRAMHDRGGIPEYVEYRRYAVQERAIDGVLSLASMSRLVAAVYQLSSSDAQARLQLEFIEDAQRRVRIDGHVVAPVVLRCQRCTMPFDYVIDASVAGVVVADDAAAASIPRVDEPIMADGDTLSVAGLVEDELLLALPMVARCSRPDCQTRYNVGTEEAQPKKTGSGQRRQNPFSVLEDIKHKRDTD